VNRATSRGLPGKSSGSPKQNNIRTSRMQRRLFCSLFAFSLLALSTSMDPGRSGVWDSPSTQDYWIKRFGFMFGGGRSGVKGMKALQESVARRSRGHHGSFFKTDLAPHEASPKAIRLLKEKYMDKDPERITSLSQKPRLSALRSASSSSSSRLLSQERNMVQLEPFMVNIKDRNPKRFERFMAVP